MAVKSNRINTSVSFAFANIAKNSLEVKTGDLLSFTSDGFVTKAAPDSLIIGICNEKASFPETNETQEQWRVDYNPVIWENTYKMEVKGDDVSGLKVGYFYTMDANQKLDPATASPSVGQFMVQDIYAKCVDVRFVTNVGLAIPQYQDTKLASIRPTNPDSYPFDGLYTFTLSDGTTIEGDFSDLAWYLGDVTITGTLTTQGDIVSEGDISTDGTLNVTGNSTLGGNLEVTGNTELTGTLTANDDVAINGDTTITGDTSITGNVGITGNTTQTGNQSIDGTISATGNVSTNANLNVGGISTFADDVTISENLEVTGNSEIGGTLEVTGQTTLKDNTTINRNLQVDGQTKFVGAGEFDSAVEFKDSVDIDRDLNVDGSAHVGGSATIDHNLVVNETFTLGPNATATQFILQTEKNQANGVAALNASGKLDDSVLPPLAIGETFVVSSEAQMLALTAQTGDRAVRTDISKTFVKLNNTTPSSLSDRQVLMTSGEVISVNGETGAVVLDADDISDTGTVKKFVTAAQITARTNKQDAIGYTPENQANKDTVTLVNDSTHYPSSSVVKTLLDGKQDSLGYTAEDISNKDTATLIDSSTHYPSSHVVYDQLATKQPTLQNQVNIKSINNQSLLGSGNLTITADVDFYYEQTSQGVQTYTLQHTPISDNSIMVFSDSGTAMFPMIDYTITNGVITFVSLGATESAIIRVAAQVSNP